MKHLSSLVFFIFFLLSFHPLLAQDTAGEQSEETYQEPDVPGVLYVALGWSILNDRPESMENNLWGSRAFQMYYFYDLSGDEDKMFALRPGFGISSYKFKFETRDDPGATSTLAKVNNNTTQAIPLDSINILQGITNLRKSQFEIVYIDIPLELVYNGKKEVERKGFYFALGVRAGLRIDSKTKAVFFQEGERRKYKTKNNLNLQTLRFSAGGRAGYGKFSLFYWWTINSLFENDEGPVGTENTTYMTFGVSLSLL